MRINYTRVPFLCQIIGHKAGTRWDLRVGQYVRACLRCGTTI